MNTPQLVLPLAEQDGHPLSRFGRGFILVLVIVPLLGLIYGVWEIWGQGVDWFYLVLLFFSYVIRELGVTVGFHRLFTHESFKTKPFIELLLGIFGSMAYQGRLVVWCSNHSEHHQHSDKDGDPHSPWRFGTSPWALFKGFWYAHFVWLFFNDGLLENNCTRRLAQNRRHPSSIATRWLG